MQGCMGMCFRLGSCDVEAQQASAEVPTTSAEVLHKFDLPQLRLSFREED